MKEISNKEFEGYVKDLINKKITHVALARLLHTDTRTLLNRIYSLENEKLLTEYVKNNPYKPRENRNIDYESLVIELITDRKSVSAIQEEYHIAERTYRRNIEKLKSQNSTLYWIYKKYTTGQMTNEDWEYLKSLQEGKVCYTKDSVEDRKAQLMGLFSTYDILKEKGLEPEEILDELGETVKSLKRKSDELQRILIQERLLNDESDIKQRLKVDIIPTVNLRENKSESEDREKVEIETEEREN